MCGSGAKGAVEVLPGTLVWAPETDNAQPDLGPSRRTLDFCRDPAGSGPCAGVYSVPHYHAEALGRAFGPLGLPSILIFCGGLDASLSEAEEAGGKPLTLTTPRGDAAYRANAAVLLGAFLVLRRDWPVVRLAEALGVVEAETRFPCSWASSTKPEEERVMSVRDCWEGLALANRMGWIGLGPRGDDMVLSQACAEHRHMAARYDASWIVPGLVMVAADPITVTSDPNPMTCSSLLPPDGEAAVGSKDDGEEDMAGDDDGLNSVDTVCKEYDYRVESNYVSTICSMEPLAYVTWLQSCRVGLVVRANFDREKGMPARSYKDGIFKPYGITNANIRVVDEQGGLPAPRDIAKFLELADSSQSSVIMVHCKGGFGRSATLACCLVAERFDVPGAALLGWMRIVRPGAFTTRKQEVFLRGIRGRSDVRRAAGKAEGGGTSASCTGCALQ